MKIIFLCMGRMYFSERLTLFSVERTFCNSMRFSEVAFIRFVVQGTARISTKINPLTPKSDWYVNSPYIL